MLWDGAVAECNIHYCLSCSGFHVKFSKNLFRTYVQNDTCFVAMSISVLLASVEWGLNSNVSQIFTINTIKHPEPIL